MIKAIEISKINRGTNIREENDGEIMELVNSIRTNGLLNPITVVRKGEKFSVVAGHRRFLAMQLLREPFVDCNILDHVPDKKELLCIQLQENCCRKDMSAWELVDLFEQLRKEGMSQEKIGVMCGKSQSWVSVQYSAAKALEKHGNVTKETKKWSVARVRKEYGSLTSETYESHRKQQTVVCYRTGTNSNSYKVIIRNLAAQKEFEAYMKEFQKKWPN